jgi:hypothetical protein
LKKPIQKKPFNEKCRCLGGKISRKMQAAWNVKNITNARENVEKFYEDDQFGLFFPNSTKLILNMLMFLKTCFEKKIQVFHT